MENFKLYNPTVLHFGENVVDKLSSKIKKYGNKVLFVLGKGSVIKHGYYDIVTKHLEENNIEHIDFKGIKPNPGIEDVNDAIKIGIENNVELVLALGGGSAIDSAKIIALCIKENLNAWDVVKGKIEPKEALPIITILTIAATGTEMNHFAVIQNKKTKEKVGFRNELMYPKHSFLDPKFTYSVPTNYTAFGIVDIIAHSLENYFGEGDSPLSDRFSASIIIETMNFAPLVLKEANNYEYRANMMLQSTYALNGTLASGKISGDWGVHAIGHTLSVLYDIPHGASLSIAYPAWLKLMKSKIPERIKTISKLIFNIEDIDLFIEKLETFFTSINSPINLFEAKIYEDKKEDIVNLMTRNKISGYNYKFNEYDEIVNLMFSVKNRANKFK